MAYCSATEVSDFIGTKVFSTSTRPTLSFVNIIIDNVTSEINRYTANAFEETYTEAEETYDAEAQNIDSQSRMNIKLRHRMVFPFSQLSSVTINDGGTGYTTATLEVVGDCVTQAEVEATIEEGVITGYTITEAGEGYKETPTITVTGDGTGASLTAVLTNDSLDAVSGAQFVDYKKDRDLGYNEDYYFDYPSGRLFFKKYPDMGNKHIKIRYRYGNYEEVPSDIKMAAILLSAAHIISQDDRAFLTVDGSQVTPTNKEKAGMWRKEAYNILRRRAEINLFV